MVVQCTECGVSYDDTYHLTYCPHEYFEMRTVVHRGKGETRLCRSVEELHAFLDGRLPPTEVS